MKLVEVTREFKLEYLKNTLKPIVVKWDITQKETQEIIKKKEKNNERKK